MKKKFADVISSLGLPQDVVTDLTEAWNSQVEENKKALREEMSGGDTTDMVYLTQAAEALIKETLEVQSKEAERIKQEVVAEQERAVSKLRKANKVYAIVKEKTKALEESLERQAQAASSFVAEVLTKELKEFHESRREDVANLRKELAESKREREELKRIEQKRAKEAHSFVIETLQDEIRELHDDRKRMLESVEKLEYVTISQLSEELSEFQEDKRALKEARIELELDAQRKIQDFKDEFVKKTAPAAAKLVSETLHSELTSLKQSLNEARENNFGRRIFEAFAAEYSSSVFNENSLNSRLHTQLKESSKNIAKLQAIIEKQSSELNTKERKLNEAVETATREKKLGKLVSSLTGVRKNMMLRLLESVETDKLEKEFTRYLPQVVGSDIKEETKQQVRLDESKSGSMKPVRKLSESKGQRTTSKHLAEKLEQKGQVDYSDIDEIIKKAGIGNK